TGVGEETTLRADGGLRKSNAANVADKEPTFRDCPAGKSSTTDSMIYFLPPTCLITLQGFPTATRLAGTSRTTTRPAPITLLSPIGTPGQTTQRPPRHTLLPMLTGLADSS